MAKIKHAGNGKRDLHGLEHEFDNSLLELQDEDWDFLGNRDIVIEYIKACRKGKARSAGRNIRVGKSTLYRILGILRMLSEDWLRKDFDEATGEDWQNVYDRMEEDKILNSYGNTYAPSSKAKNYKTMKKFLKWRYGGNKQYPEYCQDWVTTEPARSRTHITRSDAEKIIEATSTLKNKCMFMMLFDGGFRVEELANLRWVDVRKPEGKDYYRAHVRAETSKNKEGRKVSMWLATDFIDSYRNSEAKKEGFNEIDYMFKTTYQAIYKFVKRKGKQVLKKDISPHILRHSSATYYASVIKTYGQFCARYGWKLRSSAPQRYFHAVSDDEVADTTKEHEIARFKTEFERIKVENQNIKEEIARREQKDEEYNEELEAMREQHEKLRKQLRGVAKMLAKEKGVDLDLITS